MEIASMTSFYLKFHDETIEEILASGTPGFSTLADAIAYAQQELDGGSEFAVVDAAKDYQVVHSGITVETLWSRSEDAEYGNA